MRRFVFTSIAIAIGLLFAIAPLWSSAPSPAPEQEDTAADEGEAKREKGEASSAEKSDGSGEQRTKTKRPTDAERGRAEDPAPPSEGDQAAEPRGAEGPTAPLATPLRVEADGPTEEVTLGARDADSPFELQVRLTHFGAAVHRVGLAHHAKAPDGGEPYAVAQTLSGETRRGGRYAQTPLAARELRIADTRIDLQGLERPQGRTKWGVVERDGRRSVTYGLTIHDAEDEPVLRLRRRYRVAKGRYELKCRQRITNVGAGPHELVWKQNGLGDVPPDRAAYMGDRRRLAAGYFDLAYAPKRNFITTRDTFPWRSTLLDRVGEDMIAWPRPDLPKEAELAWLAHVNRYFAAVVHPRVPEPEKAASMPALDRRFPEIELVAYGVGEQRKLMSRMATGRFRLPAQAEKELDLGLYFGPRDRDVLGTQAPYQALRMDQVVVYSLGFCSFEPLARGLLALLKAFHYVVRDWGVAIILLVALVRVILHPITRRAQINMQKMQKQMQAIQPELERLKKKYENDPKKFQQEQIRLFREKNINPANALGCLPMFLQAPIWIALYSMLYFAVDLRHEPAFYGVFQMLSGGGWGFLADLSRADHFIKFPGDGFTLPLPFINPAFNALNVLPILMAVVFFLQMKMTNPEPTTEQQAQQQRMMKIMPLIFPVFLYSAPSGLTLYICASTFGGMVDSYLVRKRVREMEAAGTLFESKKPRQEGGFMDRLQKTVEQQIERQQQGGGGASSASGGGPQPGPKGGGGGKKGKKKR
jgi:YidC/Oxa1 family membrane protein insertase